MFPIVTVIDFESLNEVVIIINIIKQCYSFSPEHGITLIKLQDAVCFLREGYSAFSCPVINA